MFEASMFEIVVPPTPDGSSAGNGGAGNVAHASSQGKGGLIPEGSLRKVMLPRRDGEPRFGPQSYYYVASRTGVVPSGV